MATVPNRLPTVQWLRQRWADRYHQLNQVAAAHFLGAPKRDEPRAIKWAIIYNFLKSIIQECGGQDVHATTQVEGYTINSPVVLESISNLCAVRTFDNVRRLFVRLETLVGPQGLANRQGDLSPSDRGRFVHLQALSRADWNYRAENDRFGLRDMRVARVREIVTELEGRYMSSGL